MKSAYVIMLTLNRRLTKAQFKAEYTLIRVYMNNYLDMHAMSDEYFHETNINL